MSRPLRDGIDYFPLDVGFLEDKKTKLIKAEFGSKGVVILLQLLCSIYGGSGYFLPWDDDDCFLMSDGVGCGITPELIREIVAGCIRRSIFDERVFNMFGVLTSRGIQRRYLRAIGTREEIGMIEEYWLLDINDKKDVQSSISKKITFKNVSLQRNPDKKQRNPDKKQIYPQSKVEESRVKERRGEKRKDGDPGGDQGALFQLFEDCGFRITGRAAEQLIALSEEYSEAWVMEAIKRAADRGKKSLAYIRGILANWQVNGAIDTPQQQPKGRSASFLDV